MTNAKHSDSNGSIVQQLRRVGVDAIDTYERQTGDAIAQGRELSKQIPVVSSFAGAQADLAHLVVEAQARTARQLIGA